MKDFSFIEIFVHVCLMTLASFITFGICHIPNISYDLIFGGGIMLLIPILSIVFEDGFDLEDKKFILFIAYLIFAMSGFATYWVFV